MSWAAIIAILVEVLKQRAAAGWPLLKLILEYFGAKIQKEADDDVSPITVGAAPDEVKDQIIAWLEARKAAAPIGMKFVWTLVIRFVPLVADQLWDSLFQKQLVGRPLSDFTPATFGAAPQTEAEIVADCCDE